MADNKYCNLPGPSKISDTFGRINDGFALVEQDMNDRTSTDSSLQQQITTEQQARIAADTAHQQSTTAHPAQNITYSGSVSGQSNVKGALDKLQEEVDAIVSVPNDGNAEIVQAREDLDGTVYPTLGARLDHMEESLIQKPTITSTLRNGLNLITTDQASPMDGTVYGRTLVNILGKDGGCESLAPFTTAGTSPPTVSTTQKRSGSSSIKVAVSGQTSYAFKDFNYPLDSSKQYILACWIYVESQTAGDVSVSLRDIGTNTSRYSCIANMATVGSWQFLYTKIPTANVLAGNGFRLVIGTLSSTTFVAYVDDIRLYELSTADYNAIGTTYTGEQIDGFIPYVDSIQHLQGAAIRKFGKNLYDGEIVATGAVPTILLGANGDLDLTSDAVAFRFVTIRKYAVIPGNTYTLSCFATNVSGPNTPTISVRKGSDGSPLTTALTGTGKVSITFNVGSEKEIQLFIYASQSTATVQRKRYEQVQLELGTTVTSYEPRNDDYVYIPTKLASSVDGTVRDSVDIRTGQVTRRWRTDFVLDGSYAWVFSDDSTGYKRVNFPFATPYGGLPNSDRFYCTKNDGSPLTSKAFNSQDGTNQIGTGSNGLQVTISDSDSGWGEDFQPSTAEIKAYFFGWKMNNGTFGQPYNGSGTKTWIPLNATSNTGAVTTVPTVPSSAITSGTYDYYRLSYQLATTVTEAVEGFEGSIGLHDGGNAVELLEGVIVREKVTPQTSSTTAHINNTTFPSSQLKNRASQIIRIYKNGLPDPNWSVVSDANAYGLVRASISLTMYDPTAEYTVTYIALDRYKLTSNAVEASVTYQANMSGVVGDLVQRMADNETKDTVQDWALDWVEAKADNNAFDIVKLFEMPFYLYHQATINGNFDIAQRGTSFNITPTSVTYTLDRWRLDNNPEGGTMPTMVLSQQRLMDIPGSAYFCRLNVNGAGEGYGNSANCTLNQFVENGTRYLCGAGKKLTLSFWARSSIAGKRLGFHLEQKYGSGGSPTTEEIMSGTTVTLTSAWTKYSFTFTTFSLEGKTFGANNDDSVAIRFWYIWGSDYQSRFGATTPETFGGAGNIDIAQVKLNAGESALPFQPRSFAEELALCQRYFEKSYEVDVAPQSNNPIGMVAFGANSGVPQTFHVDFKVRKRAIPSVYTYSPFSTNPGGTGSSARYFVGTIEATDGIINYIGTSGFNMEALTTIDQSRAFHWTADAEL
ncbi:carbohydrate binding domain-containing protein [Cohnella massiliensis]|uniref:carbohydrate binding domain-containing protein n=1 Tax=Cohnella massiliensis TaxID=1816691 RepID=UPI0009BB47C4|nr:carbohydrate binding domain-containing protein [Cohnella massiliensis]